MRLLPILAAMVLASCAGLAHPTALDAERANARWPGTTLDSLEQGRQLYVVHCGGCHALPLPDERPAGEWSGVLDDMQKRAGLQPSERELVERFLVVMSTPGH